MDPMTWVMLALMLAGTGAQAQATHKVGKEQNKALAEERERREKRQRENETSAQQSMQLFSGQKEKEAAAAAAREQATRTQLPAPTTDAAGETRFLDPSAPPSATNVKFATDTLNRENDYLATRAKLRAALNSYGDVMQQTGTAATRFGQDIDARNQSIQRFQEYVLPARMRYAGQTGREWSTAGDVMKLAAMVMAPYALGGGGAAGVSPGSTAAASANAEAAAAGLVQPGVGAAASQFGSAFNPYWFMTPNQQAAARFIPMY
jgi:Tfp pilus assembly protein FimT